MSQNKTVFNRLKYMLKTVKFENNLINKTAQ